jgi:hypothetical protein
MAGSDGSDSHSGRALDYLREAVVDLEVWRQNARSAEERQTLQRVTALLHHAASELRSNEIAPKDPGQHALPLLGAGADAASVPG